MIIKQQTYQVLICLGVKNAPECHNRKKIKWNKFAWLMQVVSSVLNAWTMPI